MQPSYIHCSQFTAYAHVYRYISCITTRMQHIVPATVAVNLRVLRGAVLIEIGLRQSLLERRLLTAAAARAGCVQVRRS